MKRPRRQWGRISKLSQATRDEIVRRASVKGDTWEEIAKWLRTEKRCRVSTSSLSVWYSRHCAQEQLKAQMEHHAQQAETMLQCLARQLPDLPREKLEAFGQNAFAILALQQGDPKIWAQIYSLRLRERELEIERERVEILKKKAEQAEKARGVAESELSAEEKERQLREIFGLPTKR